MATLRLVPTLRALDLFKRLRFDPALEDEACRQLSALDLDLCLASYGRLVDQLDVAAPGVPDREVVLLLLDVLLRVNRRLHRHPDGDARCQENRAALIAQFAAHDTAQTARGDFMPTLHRLLAVVQSPAKAHPLVERAQAFIEENYHHHLSLSEIARTLHASPNYLSRVFRRETGMTLTAQIHRERLAHARLLLAVGGRSISEIAYLVGYQNYRDFYRNFVKYERASPRQARRSINRAEEARSGPSLE